MCEPRNSVGTLFPTVYPAPGPQAGTRESPAGVSCMSKRVPRSKLLIYEVLRWHHSPLGVTIKMGCINGRFESWYFVVVWNWQPWGPLELSRCNKGSELSNLCSEGRCYSLYLQRFQNRNWYWLRGWLEFLVCEIKRCLLLGRKVMTKLLLPLSRLSHVRLCNPIDSSPLGSSVPGILQARTLEWVAISFSIWPS